MTDDDAIKAVARALRETDGASGTWAEISYRGFANVFLGLGKRIGLAPADLAGLADGSRVVVPVNRTFEAGVRAIRSEVYALHDDTLARYHDCGRADTEGKPGAYARGRCAEAKSIARAIGEVVYALSAYDGAGAGESEG